jgi:hypothetical protein
VSIAFQADRPACSRRAIALCCDDRYLPFAAFMAWQIATLSPERDFDICICSIDGLELPKSLDHLGVRLCQIEAEAAFDGMGRDQRQTVSTYLRLALPDAFANDYDRILYLDSDIFVQGGDLAALLSIDLKGRPIAAVRDNPQWRTPNRRPADLKALGLAAAPYFNAGVLLIETRPWLDANTLGRAQVVGQTQADKLVHKDQTLLNVVFHQNWAEISPVWNWQYVQKSRLFESMADAHLVHFIGPNKPWKDPKGIFPPRFAKALAPFVATHFPDRGSITIRSEPARNSAEMRKMLRLHYIAAPRMAHYLDRFPTDMTVHT